MGTGIIVMKFETGGYIELVNLGEILYWAAVFPMDLIFRMGVYGLCYSKRYICFTEKYRKCFTYEVLIEVNNSIL